MKTRKFRNIALCGALGGAALALDAAPAAACGGLFCSQTLPVNQAAERIIFADNGDGTVTAVIQIMYEGPSESFSWLLPISSVPDEEDEIAVASDLAFQRLQAATNPQYNLNTRVEGTCRADENLNVQGNSAAAESAPAEYAPDSDDSGGVTVAASGIVGSFDWTALALDPALDDPAGAAIAWLTANGYDVLPQTGELIGPYLESGMYLLALKLTKGSNTGSIRPIVLTYDGEQPSIPIKLTAVAANDNMGVMTWMLSDARAVPYNYSALELNEARINWFNAASNYESVVTAAADDIGGQGFVTEFAGPPQAVASVVWQDFEESEWQGYRTRQYSSFGEVFLNSYYRYQGFDGFWDAVRGNVTLPEGVTFEDLQSCPECYAESLTLSPTAYLNAIDATVIEPLRLVQRLIDAHPYMTRLYSTLSAADMTADPIFTYNASLPEVSNVHTADRVIECSSSVYQWEAPWRIELPQGGIIRGTAADVGTWPEQLNDQPPNLRVLALSDTGSGVVAQDNTAEIQAQLASYNEGVPAPVAMNDPFTPGIRGDDGFGSGMTPSVMDPAGSSRSRSSGACAVSGGAGQGRGAGGWAALLLLLGVGVRRRRS